MANPQVTLVGNLTADPELRFTASGKAVASMTVATSDSTKNDAGQWEDKNPTFTRITVWDKTAENAAESLQKGDPVVAVGKIGTRTWQDKEGNTQYRTEMLSCWALAYDLRRATIKVERIAREKPSAQAPDDPWATSAPPADPWAATTPPPF